MQEHQYQLDLRMRFIYFLGELKYLEQLFDYAERDRLARMQPMMDALQKDPAMDYHAMLQRLGRDYFDEYNHAELMAKYLMVHAVFLSMYAAFEFQLASIATAMHIQSGNAGMFEDAVNGNSYFDKARKYLQRYHHVAAASASQPAWEQINLFRKVRNGMIHSHNRLKSSDEKKCKPFLASYQVSFDNDARFYIRNAKFVKDFAAISRDFLHAIIKEIAPVPPFVPQSIA
jgi:hypothetical protein